MAFSPSAKIKRLCENPFLRIFIETQIYFTRYHSISGQAAPFALLLPHSNRTLSCPFPFYGGNSVLSYPAASAAFRKAAPRSVPLPLPAVSHPPAALCFLTSGYYSSSSLLPYSVLMIVAQLFRRTQGAYLINYVDLFYPLLPTPIKICSIFWLYVL